MCTHTHTHTHTQTHAPAGMASLPASPCGLHGGHAVVCPLAWLWRGAGTSRRRLRFQALPATAGGCEALRATTLPARATSLLLCSEVGAPHKPKHPPAPPDAGTGLPLPMPPPALGTTHKQGFFPPAPHASAGSGGQDPPSSGCLAQEKTQWLVVSTDEPWLQNWPLPPSPHLHPWGPPQLSLPVPPIPGGSQCMAVPGFGGAAGGVLGVPTAPLRNPQPAPGTSSRSQREPADLAAEIEGGGMEGGREAG